MGGWGRVSSGSEEKSPPLVQDLGGSPVPRPLPCTGPGGVSAPGVCVTVWELGLMVSGRDSRRSCCAGLG